MSAIIKTAGQKYIKLFNLYRELKAHRGGRDLISYLKKMKLSYRQAANIVFIFKKTVSPFESLKRMMLSRKYSNSQPLLTLEKHKQYLYLKEDELFGVSGLVAFYADLFKKKEQMVIKKYKPPYASVINSSIDIEDPEEIRPILQFSKQPKIFNTLCSYFGELPVLSNCTLSYTAPCFKNERNLQSVNFFHRDMDGKHQLHLIINIEDVDLESGPFTFLSSKLSEFVTKKLGYDQGRVTDDKIFSLIDPSEIQSFTGKAGECLLVNPYHCFHYGARTKNKRRLVLIINYTTLFHPAEAKYSIFKAGNRKLIDDGSLESSALLNLL